MTAPRHLWSGDWRRESAASARELAERRARDEEPTAAQAPAPAEAPAPARPKERAREDAAPKQREPATAPKQRAVPAPARDSRAREPVAARPRATAAASRPSPTAPRPGEATGWRSWHGSRFAVVFLAVLVSGGIAYAAVSALVGSGGDSTPPISQPSAPAQSTPATNGPAWLGVQTQSVGAAGGGFSSGSGNTGGLSSGSGNTGAVPSGSGAVVTNVAPGSPADAAGLEPGDVITQIDSRTVSSPNDINSALAGMHVGQQVEIQYQRGPFADAAQVTLAARPAGTP